MPHKDPSFWTVLITSIYTAVAESSTLQGAIMAVIISILRVLYDSQETKPIRVLLEACLCGALSLCITSIVDTTNLPPSVCVTVGGAIGFIGVNTLRDFIIKAIKKRIDK